LRYKLGWRRALRTLARAKWPVLAILGVLWFPFDWLSVVWPPFGGSFRMVFHNARDHLIGHTTFFLIVGLLILAYLPALRRRPLWYALGLVLAELLAGSPGRGAGQPPAENTDTLSTRADQRNWSMSVTRAARYPAAASGRASRDRAAGLQLT